MSERPVSAEPARVPPPVRSLRVLVADDNVDLLATLEFLLRDEGYEVRVAQDGSEAALALADFDPDIVIADIKMPRRSGWELAKLVRRIGDDVQPRPLLIAVSGHYNKSSDRILTTMAGFDHFFAKPVDPQALIGLVNRYRERLG